MKNVIRGLFLYGVYWFITAIACDGLYEAGINLNNALEDIIRIFLPIILVAITWMIFKISKKKNSSSCDEKLEDSMPIVDGAMKIFGVTFAGFVIALVIIHVYMVFTMK